MAFWRALSYSKGKNLCISVMTLTGAILNDFLQKRIQGWGEHSQEESQTLNNGQIGGKLSQLALFWRINTEGRRQTESKRERQKVDPERFSSQTPNPQTPGGHQEGRRLCSTSKSTLRQKYIKLWKVQLQYSNSTTAAGEVSRCRQCSLVEVSSSA